MLNPVVCTSLLVKFQSFPKPSKYDNDDFGQRPLIVLVGDISTKCLRSFWIEYFLVSCRYEDLNKL